MEKLENRFLVLLSWIHSVLLFAGIYLVAAAFYGYRGSSLTRYFLRCLILLLPVVVSWLVVRRLRNFILYQAFGAAVTVAVWAVTQCILTAVFTELIFILRSHAWIARAHNKKIEQETMGLANPEPELWEIPTMLDRPQIWHCIWHLILYLGLIFTRRRDLLTIMFYLLVSEIVVCFTFNYLDWQQDFIRKCRNVANLPVRTMRKNRQVILGMALILLLLFMLPAMLFGKEPLTGLLDLIKPLDIEFQIETEEPQPQGDGMMEMLKSLGIDEAAEPPAWFQALTNIIMYGILMVFLIFVLRLLYGLCCRMMQSFAAGEPDDELIFPDRETEEKQEPGIRPRSGFRSTPASAIRRKYRKLIWQRARTKITGTETPGELEAKAGLRSTPKNSALPSVRRSPGQENLSSDPLQSEKNNSLSGALSPENENHVSGADASVTYLHAVYEKARYSREGCTRDEAKEFKNYWKTHNLPESVNITEDM